MKILVTEFASTEFNEICLYYFSQNPVLKLMFALEVSRSFSIIKEYPSLGKTIDNHLRQTLMSKFPYRIIYSVKSDHIAIIAFAHQHRKPNYFSLSEP